MRYYCVDLTGVEPRASWLRVRRSNHWATDEPHLPYVFIYIIQHLLSALYTNKHAPMRHLPSSASFHLFNVVCNCIIIVA